MDRLVLFTNVHDVDFFLLGEPYKSSDSIESFVAFLEEHFSAAKFHAFIL